MNIVYKTYGLKIDYYTRVKERSGQELDARVDTNQRHVLIKTNNTNN